MKPTPLAISFPSQSLPSDHLEPLNKDFRQSMHPAGLIHPTRKFPEVDGFTKGQQVPCEKGWREPAASTPLPGSHHVLISVPLPALSGPMAAPTSLHHSCSRYDQELKVAGPPFRSKAGRGGPLAFTVMNI